jgi:GTP cyclohydrolase I
MGYKMKQQEASEFARELLDMLPDGSCTLVGIPRGGLATAYLMATHRKPDTTIRVRSVDDWTHDQMTEDLGCGEPVVLVDDIAVTGETLLRTRDQIRKAAGFTHYAVLVLKPGNEAGLPTPLVNATRVPQEDWVEFPWESREVGGKPEDAVRRLIEYLGDDPTREGLEDTPRRVLGFLDELRERRTEPVVVTVFPTEVDDLTVVSGVPFDSLCEHHMLPYSGVMHVGYIPNGQVLGLSKIPRGIAAIAAGLTIQEGLTHEVGRFVARVAGTESVAVVSTATHTCVTMRGPRVPGTEMVSSSMQGRFRADADLRAEFMSIVRSS